MRTIPQIDLQELPENAQQEVYDFYLFIKQRVSDNQFLNTKTDIKLKKQEPNGKVIATISDRIAARGDAFNDIEDPLQWQRKIRSDRPLPGRDV
ncbi:MAG: hypothetical protein KZQ83_13440 [gamma proteobacterium symbiont of Taylorina sp.]|nr:hypothetical protein [gamma proteobacterium symbiont of Taylorina sp.]